VIINVLRNGQPGGGHALVVNDTSDVTSGTVSLVSQNSGYLKKSEPVVSGKISGGRVTVGGGGSGWIYTTVGVVHAPVWATVSAGGNSTCAIRTDGTLWCWGYNLQGELGTGDTADRLTPAQAGTATTWATVSAGGSAACAVRRDGTLWCWGDNSQAEPGTGDTNEWLTPARVGTATTWAAVSAGAEDTCAIRRNGTLWCWGLNGGGELGTGDLNDRLRPTRIGTATSRATVSTGDSACATRRDGTLWCWGYNLDGELGTGDTRDRLTPARAGTARTWAKVTASLYGFAAAIRAGGTLWCWGDGRDGQLGTGDTGNRLTPTQVN